MAGSVTGDSINPKSRSPLLSRSVIPGELSLVIRISTLGYFFLKIDHRVYDDVVSNRKANTDFNDTADGITYELLIELYRLIKQ